MNNQLPTLLIVEDDENDYFFLERALVAAKLEVQIQRACDGLEAIEYLAGENDFADREVHPLPHLMVLDLKMPGKDGFEVLAWMREQAELGTLPVVVFSSSEEPGDVENAYNLGAAGYLVKPSSYISYSEIVRTLGEFLVNGYEQKPAERKAGSARRAMNSREVV
jgi:CheY-like chemotaxis protein